MPGYVVGSAADPSPERRAKRQQLEGILTQDLVRAGGGDEFHVSTVVTGIVHSYLTERNTYAFDFVLRIGGDAVAELLLWLAES